MARLDRNSTKLALVAMQLHVTPGAEWHAMVTKSYTTPVSCWESPTLKQPSFAYGGGRTNICGDG
jgi:hypothetical protein